MTDQNNSSEQMREALEPTDVSSHGSGIHFVPVLPKWAESFSEHEKGIIKDIQVMTGERKYGFWYSAIAGGALSLMGRLAALASQQPSYVELEEECRMLSASLKDRDAKLAEYEAAISLLTEVAEYLEGSKTKQSKDIKTTSDRLAEQLRTLLSAPAQAAAEPMTDAAPQSPAPQDAKDAELYRELRAMHWDDGKLTVIEAKNLPLGIQTYSGEMLDAVITAQREKK